MVHGIARMVAAWRVWSAGVWQLPGLLIAHREPLKREGFQNWRNGWVATQVPGVPCWRGMMRRRHRSRGLTCSRNGLKGSCQGCIACALPQYFWQGLHGGNIDRLKGVS